MNAVASDVMQFQMPADWSTLDMLDAIDMADPASLDLVLLVGPLKKQLDEMKDMGDELPPEMFDLARKLEDVVDALEHEICQRLDKLCEEKRQDWLKAVKARQPIEDRWIDDFRQYMSESRVLESKLYPFDTADPRSNAGPSKPITVAATRRRVLMCWSRLVDVMLPANDLPIRVEPVDDPDPEDYPTAIGQHMQQAAALAQQQAQASGQPVGVQAPPQLDKGALQGIAKQAATDMQDRVFAACKRAGFEAKVSRMLFDTALLGCGIVKGPHPEIERRRRRVKSAPGQPAGLGDFEMVETARAGMSYVNPWFFWYDMTPTLAESSNTYEIHLMSRRQMEDFKSYPRVLTDVVDEILADDDCAKLKGEFRQAIERRNNLLEIHERVDDVYAVLETHTIMAPDKFEKATGTKWDHPDPPLVHLWSCDGRCIKWKITPLERDYRVDYYSTTIMRADDTIYGYGYAWMARGAQKITDGAMNATLANAGASVAPLLLVAQGKVAPNRENWRMQGLNVFSVLNPDGPLEQAFASVKIDSNVQENLQLVEMAQQMMDADTLFDQIQQGSFNGEEMPASGFVMAANLGSVFQKAIARNTDDDFFAPFGERMVWWVTMYEKDAPEGEFHARGIASTQLVQKDLALQHMAAFTQFTSQPRFAGRTDDQTLLEAFAHNIDGLPEGIVLDREKAEANVAAMQAAAQKGDPNKAAELASREKIAGAEITSKQAQQQAELELERERMAHERWIEQVKFNTAVVQANAQGQIELFKIQADDARDRFKTTLQETNKTNIEAAKLNATPSPYSAKD